MTLTAQHALELVTPAVANPILLSEAKAQLRVEHNDDDVIIARLINAYLFLERDTGHFRPAVIYFLRRRSTRLGLSSFGGRLLLRPGLVGRPFVDVRNLFH